jgi:hypothetical protein
MNISLPFLPASTSLSLQYTVYIRDKLLVELCRILHTIS